MFVGVVASCGVYDAGFAVCVCFLWLVGWVCFGFSCCWLCPGLLVLGVYGCSRFAIVLVWLGARL